MELQGSAALAEVGAVLAATGLALAPLATAVVRWIVPRREIAIVRWNLAHVALVALVGGAAFGAIVLARTAAGLAPDGAAAVGPASQPSSRASPDSEAPNVIVDLALTAAILAASALAAFLVVRRQDEDGVRHLGLARGGRLRGALAGLACYVLFLPGLLGVGMLWPWILRVLGAGERQQLVLERIRDLSPGERPVAALLGILILPFFEEFLFRGFVQPVLVQGTSERVGLVATSLVFALLHGLAAFLPIFALSLLLGWIMLRTRRLLAAWTVHALHNALTFVALFAAPGLLPATLAVASRANAIGAAEPSSGALGMATLGTRTSVAPTNGALGPAAQPGVGASGTWRNAPAAVHSRAVTNFPRQGLFRRVDGGAFVAANAIVTGDVTLGEDVGIWFGCVVRGDDAPLTIGARTNVQDLTMVHADTGVPNVIGEDVTVGHRCVLHGARIEDRCLIGMGAVLLGGSVIGAESLVAAGAVVKEDFHVPPRSLVAGVPARVLRLLTDAEVEAIKKSADGYVKKIRLYLGPRFKDELDT